MQNAEAAAIPTSTGLHYNSSVSEATSPSFMSDYPTTKPLIPIADDYTTFFGYLGSTNDALLLIEGSYSGLCRRTRRRLHSRDHDLIRSGAVFVFDETEANVSHHANSLCSWSPER